MGEGATHFFCGTLTLTLKYLFQILRLQNNETDVRVLCGSF